MELGSPSSFVGRKMFEIANYPYRGTKKTRAKQSYLEQTLEHERSLSLSLSHTHTHTHTTVNKRQASEMTITSVLRRFVLRTSLNGK